MKELAAAYSLGALDPAEAQAFEAYLAANPEAQREVRPTARWARC